MNIKNKFVLGLSFGMIAFMGNDLNDNIKSDIFNMSGKIVIVPDNEEEDSSYDNQGVHKHVWDEGIVETEPDYINKGMVVYTCECGEKMCEETDTLTFEGANGIVQAPDGNWYYFADGKADTGKSGLCKGETAW